MAEVTMDQVAEMISLNRGEAELNEDGPAGAEHVVGKFPNGYGVSVIIGGWMAYGGLELAVLDGEGSLYYDSTVTSDVLGFLDNLSLAQAIQDVAQLVPEPSVVAELEW